MPGSSPPRVFTHHFTILNTVAFLLLTVLVTSCQTSPDSSRVHGPLVATSPADTLPVTTITNMCPHPGSTFIRPADFIKIRWTGYDPNNPDPGHPPAYYEWKLIPTFAVNVGDPTWWILVGPGTQYPWHRVEIDQSAVDLQLDTTHDYLFGVRAISAAGDTESTFEFGRNALLIVPSLGNPRGPILTVSETALGSVEFAHDSWVTFDVLPRCFQFHFAATGTEHCARVEDFNYAIDTTDPNSLGGFRGWSAKPITEPICLDAGIHLITVKARDDMGGITTGTMVLNVISVPRDREVLYVDDFRQPVSGAVTDASMDQQVRDMLVDAGYQAGEIDQFDTFGPGDNDINPSIPTLADLAHYRLVVWSVNGMGFNGNPALTSVTACSDLHYVLAEYLRSGGAVWIFGQNVFGALVHNPNSSACIAELNYDESTSIDPAPGEFPCDVLKLCGAVHIRDARNSPKINGLARGNPTSMATNELFPAVEIDSTVFTQAASGFGIPFVDVAFNAPAQPGLDVLYTEEAISPASGFNTRPTAFRYFDSAVSAGMGPVAVFAFPLHLLKPGSAAARTGTHGLARSMIDWFRSHEASPPGAALARGGAQ